MNIISSIFNKIFHFNQHSTQASPPPASPFSPTLSGTGEASQDIDALSLLEQMSLNSTQKLNWRESIVDLMKLLDLDSSLTNRTALAKELNYPGDFKDSAQMNIWLHAQVMDKLSHNGGRVPESFRH